MSHRKIKQKVLDLLRVQDLAPLLATLRELPAKATMNVLFSMICREEPRVRWHAISCMGDTVERIARQNMEEARIVMRRLLWSLNDESGGIGWGAPECMAEIMCCQKDLAREYVHMLLSYVREDGEELCQDGNCIEHPLLQQGVLWGVARMCECCPDLMLEHHAGDDLPPYLESPDPSTRGYAVLAAGALGLAAVRPRLLQLAGDDSVISLYWHGEFNTTSVAELARAALTTLN